jgi:hypothetical protein
MTLTFENDNDVIVYALEKIISFSRKHHYIFLAQSVWWIASIIGLQQGLITYIDNIQSRIEVGTVSDKVPEEPVTIDEKRVSPTPRELTEDQRLDRILESAERVIQDSIRDRPNHYQGRVNPLPETKTQLKKARKVKRLQEAKSKREDERLHRLQEIRTTIISRLSKN